MDESIPPFARDFPEDPELDALVRAFADGNYGLVRVEAPKLAARTKDEEIKAAARLLRERIEADPLAKRLLLLTLALLVVLTGYWLVHDQAPAGVTAPSNPPPVIERITDPPTPRPTPRPESS